MDFSMTQMDKDAGRKCKACTGAPTAALTCTQCNKVLSLSCFKKTSRTPGRETCNECRLSEEYSSDGGYTGEYAGHGQWDTMTGMAPSFESSGAGNGNGF